MTKTLIRFAEANHSVECIRLKHVKIGILLVSILFLVLVIPISFAGYDRTYNSQVQFGLSNHKVYVSVPSSLYDYYNGKTIKLTNDNEYATLVTPDTVKPIAENLRNLTRDNSRSDEAFANAVLTLVHQIPYSVNGLKYPIETLVENSGKCDTLSLLAASVMKAGGLDVVLLYFKDAHHMNVGVYLPYEPHTTWWWLSPTGYEFNGKKYWIAECTAAMDWKVGAVPSIVEDEQPWIIPLEDSEKSSPGQVSSKLGSSLNSSAISIDVSSDASDIPAQEPTLTISGSISPAYPNETVAMYYGQDGVSYNAYKTETDQWGNYTFSWNLDSTGTYYIRTSWSGNVDCTGADSEILTVFLGFPQSLMQFQRHDYYITERHGPAYAASNELRVRQGVEDFLDIQLSGKGVLLTGEFIILGDEQNTSSIQMQKITLRASEQTLGFGRRRSITIKIPERTATLPLIPEGMQLVNLPDDFDLTMNNKFGFIMRKDIGDNCSVSVRGMDDYDMSQINQLGGNGTAFLNASANIIENTWYKIVARMSEDETTVALYAIKDPLQESTAIACDKVDSNALVILMADNTDKAVAFKNLRVETLDKRAQLLPEGNEKGVNGRELLAIHIAVTILVATIFAAVVYKKRKVSALKTLSSNISTIRARVN